MLILSIWLIFSSYISEVISMTCGIDNSPVRHVYEGVARMETYPWLGILYYPYNRKRFTTAVVLVTRQIVLGAATEIDKLPKDDFRARARVVIGHNCSGPDVGVRDYSYHPDYSRHTYSTLAIIQLETDHVKMELRPICPPPSHFKNQQFFAMLLSDNCKRSKVRVHRMKYVSPDQCKSFYRRTGLDIDTMWPSHTACARSVTGGRCVWRSGAILVVKVGIRWRLLGFGVYGPGCQAPARFLDYGMYHEWVQRSVDRIGRPAITTLAQNYVVLRRTLSNVQRFGPCELEEVKRELFTDSTRIKRKGGVISVIRYNLTIISDVEYSCVVFRADYGGRRGPETPKVRLRRWCTDNVGTDKYHCFSGFQFLEIHFYVEITFSYEINFQVMAYGKEAKVIDPERAYKYLNKFIHYPHRLPFSEYRTQLVPLRKDPAYPWYGKKNCTLFPGKTWP